MSWLERVFHASFFHAQLRATIHLRPVHAAVMEAKLKPIKEEQVLVASVAEKLEKLSNCVFSPGSPLHTNRSLKCKMICTSLLILNPPFPPPFASTLVSSPPRLPQSQMDYLINEGSQNHILYVRPTNAVSVQLWEKKNSMKGSRLAILQQ